MSVVALILSVLASSQAFSIAQPGVTLAGSTFITGTCKGETASGRRIVNRFLDPTTTNQFREKHHVKAAPGEKIKGLHGAENSTTCERLLAVVLTQLSSHELHGFVPSFFQSGDQYFVVLTRPDQDNPNPRKLRTGFVPLYVIDSGFKLVTSVAM